MSGNLRAAAETGSGLQLARCNDLFLLIDFHTAWFVVESCFIMFGVLFVYNLLYFSSSSDIFLSYIKLLSNNSFYIPIINLPYSIPLLRHDNER